MFCNQQIVLAWASFPWIGCNDYVFGLPKQNIWGTLHLPSWEWWWNRLLWLLVKSSKWKSFRGKSIVSKISSSCVTSRRISWWLGSSSKLQQLGSFVRKRVCLDSWGARFLKGLLTIAVDMFYALSQFGITSFKKRPHCWWRHCFISCLLISKSFYCRQLPCPIFLGGHDESWRVCDVTFESSSSHDVNCRLLIKTLNDCVFFHC